MKSLQKTPLALAVLALTGMGLHGSALAQSNAELLNELQNLKARVQQLETQLKAPQAPASAGAVDPDEFNRIRTKVEAQEDAAESMGFKGLRISGMIDPTFVYSQRQNTAGFVFLNNFDGAEKSGPGDSFAFDNSYFGQAMLDFQKETESGQKWRLTLAPHKSASSGTNVGSIVHEASVSIPVDGASTRVIAGQLPDWSGYEYIWSNQQPLISHNLLFDFTIPSFYSGAGMEFIRGKWDTKFLVGNINEARRASGQKKPGVTYRTDYANSEFSGFGFAGTNTFETDQKVNLFEVDGYYTRGDLTMQGQIGTGTAEGLASNGGKASWSGVSGLLGYKLTNRLQLTGRADYIANSTNGGGVLGAYGDANGPDSRNGFGLPMAYDDSTGLWSTSGEKGVNRYALTVGLNYLISANHTPGSGLWNTGTWFKTELRYDTADGKVFLAPDGSYKKDNLMFSTSLVFAF